MALGVGIDFRTRALPETRGAEPRRRRGEALVLALVAVVASHCGASQPSAPAVATLDAGDAGMAGFACEDRCQLAAESPKVRLPASSELSGIAASAVHAGVFYVHNDSGDEPRFFAIDEGGALRATYRVTNARAVDWEDIAVGPCAAGSGESCLFLSDSGDNDSRRSDYVVYRVREPAALSAGTSSLPAERIPFRYPDGSHDCETLLVHPDTGRLTLVTKERSGPSRVYRFPERLTADETVTLEAAGTIAVPGGSPLVTGGDVHPEGRGVLLRTYTSLFFFPGTKGQSTEDMLSQAPCSAVVTTETQGEAVGWLRSGRGYVTLSEGPPSLHVATCAP